MVIPLPARSPVQAAGHRWRPAKRPTRELWAGHPNSLPYLVLLLAGFAELSRIYGKRSKSKLNCDEIAPATRRRLREKVWNIQRAREMKRFLLQLREKAEIIIFDRNGTLPNK